MEALRISDSRPPFNITVLLLLDFVGISDTITFCQLNYTPRIVSDFEFMYRHLGKRADYWEGQKACDQEGPSAYSERQKEPTRMIIVTIIVTEIIINMQHQRNNLTTLIHRAMPQRQAR